MPSPKRIICVGHAALDRIYRIEAFPPEPTKVRALEHVETGGGMAANASVAIARLGGKAELWSRTGDDAAGNTIRAGLKADKVDVRYMQGFEGARSSTSAIIVDDKGERLIVGQRDAGMPGGTSWLKRRARSSMLFRSIMVMPPSEPAVSPIPIAPTKAIPSRRA